MVPRRSPFGAPLAALALLVFAADARAESTDCRDGNLIETGNLQQDVLAKCGNPSWSRFYYTHSRFRRDPGMRVDEWLYDPGEGSFLRFLSFQNGVLVRIQVLSKERF